MSSDIITIEQKAKGVKRQNIRKWILRLTLVIAIIAPLTFAVAGLGAKIGLWDWRFGLGTLTRNVGPKLLVASGVLGLISLISAFMIQPRKGLTIAILALIIPVIGFLRLGAAQKKVQSLPFIHDITTDTQDVPTFTQAIMSERAEVKGVNTVTYVGKKDKEDGTLVSVLQTQTEAYADIRPLVLEGDTAEVFDQAKAAVKQLDWALKSENLESGIIEATDTTFWYGFEDDVVIRIRPSEGGGSVVDIRSVSRVGGSDIGANADRIRKFLEIMRKA
jgi:uncharacterized protein (DUF1499 family)